MEEREARRMWPALEFLRDAAASGGDRGRLESALERVALRSAPGLDHLASRHLAQLWLDIRLGVKHWSQLGCCLVPEKTMPDDVVQRVISWIQCRYFMPEYAPKVAFALGWIQGLMEYNLVNMDVLNTYYEFFFFLLNFDKYNVTVSKFIYMLTKSHDVTRARVLNLLKLSKAEKSSKHSNCLTAVINLFKTYKPEYVPESVAVISADAVFPKINKNLASAFHQAQIRCNIQTALDSETRLIWWKRTTLNSNKQNISLIPNVEYIHLNSSLYTINTEKKTCIDFQNARDLMVCNLGQSVDIPANMLSLLINDAGLHLLMFADDSLKSRFSYTLYQILYNNYLKKSTFSIEEKKIFLRKIVILQNYILQGIPVVSRFLAIFISNWNGNDFLDEILSLLEWITFDSFEELYDCILEHIETLYLTNDVYYQCSIINMLKRMYIRIHERTTDNNHKSFFPAREIKYDSIEVLSNLADYMTDLCDKSAQNVYSSVILKNTFLDAYATIGELQLNCSRPLWTVAPSSLTYGTLCSTSGYSINRMLGLILKYDIFYEKIKSHYGKNELRDQISLTHKYSADYVNCLWHSKSIEFRNEGCLLTMVPDELIEIMENSVEGYDAFLDINHHVAFALYTYMRMPSDIIENVSKSSILSIVISSNFPNITDFIQKMIENI